MSDFTLESTELRTIRDLLRFATTQFTKAGVFFGHGTSNSWDEAAALVFFVLHLDHNLFNQVLDCRVTNSERQQIMNLIAKRIATRKPLPYLTHEAWFAGLPFYVDERVLIPRSPIAELIQQHFAPWMEEHAVQRILDLGTGSGCIAIACAFAFPAAQVDASDISSAALEVAAMNVQRYELQPQVNLISSDLFSNLDPGSYDIIVSNPPYVDQEEMANLPPEYQHEPVNALAAGQDGLAVVRRILAEAAQYLRPHGILVVEVGLSKSAMEQYFSELPLTWLDFERGDDGVFLITKTQLEEFNVWQ